MEPTRELIQETFPYGAWYVPASKEGQTILLSPFEFDEEDDDLIGTAWSHPTKAFEFDFEGAVEKDAGWLVKDGNDLEVFIRPSTEASWKRLEQQLED